MRCLKVVSVSVCLSVISCPDCIFYLFVLSGSNVSHTVPFTQGSALTLTLFLDQRSRFNLILVIKFLFRAYFPMAKSGPYFTERVLVGKGVK